MKMKACEGEYMNTPEKLQKTTKVENIAPGGLGFGEGGISVRRQMELGILTAEVPGHVDKLLVSDKDAFKAVETSDDGCGDGRPWVKIMRMEANEGTKEVVEYKKSLLRPKVFGGGAIAASSMWRAVNGAPTNDLVTTDRSFIINELADRGFSHGAHTDNHAEGDNCGCGAIDKYVMITKNAIKFREQITDTLKALYGEEFNSNYDAIVEAFRVYESLAENDAYFDGSTGRRTMEQIIESGATVKELYGHHIEETIVINDVEGTTLDQQYFTQKVKEMCTDKPQVIQAFTVDIWRGRQIAEIVTDIKKAQDPTDDSELTYKIAMADFLIRTMAVAATLTAGDLPVYRRSKV